MLELNTFFN